MNDAMNSFPEHVQQLLASARIPIDQLKPVFYELAIGDQFPDDSIRLLEVNKQLIDEFENNKKLVIRGAADDFAMLCTPEQTFEVKSAETSNTLLLATPADSATANKENGCVLLKVNTILHSKLELTSCVSKVKRIRELLQQNPYRGHFDENDDENSKRKAITMESLKNEIQASDRDIEEYLKKLHVVIVDGHLRMLDFDFRTKLIEFILSLISIHDWPKESIPIDKCAYEMREMCSKSVAKQYLEQIGIPSVDGTTINLSLHLISSHYALDLLKNLEKMKLSQFMTCWRRCVPAEFPTDLEQLKDCVIISDDTISYIDIDSLSDKPDERMKTLFYRKPVWTLSELEPFLTGLTTSKAELNTLLTIHTRTIIKDGQKHFVPKYN